MFFLICYLAFGYFGRGRLFSNKAPLFPNNVPLFSNKVPFYVANQIIGSFFALFEHFLPFFVLIDLNAVNKSPSIHVFVVSGQLHKQQECRIKLLSDVVSLGHSSDYFFRSWGIMPHSYLEM